MMVGCLFTIGANARALRWAVYEAQIYNTFLSFIRKFFP